MNKQETTHTYQAFDTEMNEILKKHKINNASFAAEISNLHRNL
jgi:hypothetical protein